MTADMPLYVLQRPQPPPAGYFTLPDPDPACSPCMLPTQVPTPAMRSSAPASATATSLGPLRWTWRPHAHGQPAEAGARDWLGAQLDAAPDALPLLRDALGRPRLAAPFAGFDVNWSHSGDGLLVVLGAGVQVGIDLERRRPRPRALEIARRYFTDSEASWLAAHPEPARDSAFLRLWCAKEAVLKAHGRGLVFGLHRLEFGEHDGALRLLACDPALGAAAEWSLHAFVPQPGYHAAIAWRPRP